MKTLIYFTICLVAMFIVNAITSIIADPQGYQSLAWQLSGILYSYIVMFVHKVVHYDYTI